MEAPPNLSPKKERDEIFKKANEKNENYTLNIKLKDNNSIYISATFEGDNKLYEDIKSYEEIKKQQIYFDEYTIEEIYDELSDLISKNSIEINKEHESILFKIILPFKKKKTLDFILETKKFDNMNNDIFRDVIKQKDEIIKQKDNIIKSLEEIIKQKDLIIKNFESLLGKNKSEKEVIEKNETNSEEKQKPTNKDKDKNIDYNKIFENFNIVNQTPKYKLTNHGNNSIYTIIQLQDGRLASGGYDGSIIIYNQKTFEPEMTIKEHSSNIYDIIQLKNGNLVSCSYGDKKMNVYKINENNNYKLISQVDAGKDNEPRQIQELENGEIGLVAYNSIIFYLNINNKLDEDFNIKFNDNQIGHFYEMLPVKKGELVLSGGKDKIQFFELNSRKLKEIININRDIRWGASKLLCMINERCLCVGGANKITLIDIYNKNIIREIEESGNHICLYKLNDNILLTGKDNDITQWKINDNNLTLVCKKEKAHQSTIREIIRFNNLIISCSDDKSIKVW
jgi:WD40 repeat protein